MLVEANCCPSTTSCHSLLRSSTTGPKIIPSINRKDRPLPLPNKDSKQVQVDLQDLGYETCGRSENEAEREESTSPGESLGVGLALPH